MATKTINLTGAEVAVTGLDGANAAIRNDGADVLYAGRTPGITAGADGVTSIPAGQSAVVYGIHGAVYALGTGSALIISSDYNDNPFKSAAQGGSGADEVARAAISAHSGNADIHVTSAERAAWNAKAELSDIPTELPANGGNADKVGGKSPVDFIPVSATRKLDTSVDGTLYGTYYCEARFTPDYPLKDDGTSYGQFGILDVRVYGSISYQTMQFENGVIIHRARVVGATSWTAWQKLCDSGNAAKLGGYSASDFVLKSDYDELAARVAALEGGTT